jgi:hypothetical protein
MGVSTWITEVVAFATAAAGTYTNNKSGALKLLSVEIDFAGDPATVQFNAIRKTGASHAVASMNVGAAEKRYTSLVTNGEWIDGFVLEPTESLVIDDVAGSSTGNVFLTFEPADQR